VDHDHHGEPGFGQDGDEAVGDPRGQHDRQSRVDPQPADVGHGVEATDDVGDPIVVEEQRIAAGEDHLHERRVAGDGLERRGDAGLRGPALGVGELAAEAVAAVDGTASRGEHEPAARVLVQQARGCQAASSSGSAVKPGAGTDSAVTGRTWASSGSCGSPGRIRAANARGTSSGNPPAAARAARATAGSRPSSRQSSSGSRIASASSRCQAAAGRRAGRAAAPGPGLAADGATGNDCMATRAGIPARSSKRCGR
jgi:hypothetical protein